MRQREMWRNKVRHLDTVPRTLPVVLHYIRLCTHSVTKQCSVGQKGMFSQAKQRLCAAFMATAGDELKYMWWNQQQPAQRRERRTV